jgi:uncharacterized protein (DUF849 family)
MASSNAEHVRLVRKIIEGLGLKAATPTAHARCYI